MGRGRHGDSRRCLEVSVSFPAALGHANPILHCFIPSTPSKCGDNHHHHQRWRRILLPSIIGKEESTVRSSSSRSSIRERHAMRRQSLCTPNIILLPSTHMDTRIIARHTNNKNDRWHWSRSSDSSSSSTPAHDDDDDDSGHQRRLFDCRSLGNLVRHPAVHRHSSHQGRPERRPVVMVVVVEQRK